MNRSTRTPRKSFCRKYNRSRLLLQSLEERWVPASLVVTNAGDTGAAGQLRQVMATADSNGQDDTITFQAGITTINLLSGQISLTGDNKLLTIDGGGLVTINGDAVTATPTNRIFNFNVAGGNPTTTLKGLTLANGNLSGNNNGAAILINNDPLIVSNVTFSNNSAVGFGAGISTTSGVKANITVTNCSFINNTVVNTGSGAYGAAIYGDTSLTMNISGSTFAGNTGYNAGGAIRVAGSDSSVTIDSSTFSNNVVTFTNGRGAAIAADSNNSTWTITNCTLSANSATGSNLANGGAISASAFTVTFNLTSCTITANVTGGAGAGIRFQGGAETVSIDKCTIANNTSTTSGAGGGMHFTNLGSAGPGPLTITNTTISGNTAGFAGGGLYVLGGDATITNSTISNNSCVSTSATGGGIYMTNGGYVGTGNLTVNNSTITGNAAGTSTGAGGGIRRGGTAASITTITLNSTIVAGNTAGTTAADISSLQSPAMTIGGGNNLIGVADAGNFNLDGSNKTGTVATPLDPMLNPLANNGGPTQTMSLQAKSPAFNAGSNVLSLTTDQRGTGYARVNGSAADIGAFEGISPDPGAKVTLPNVTTSGGTTYTATVVYTDETGINTTTIDVSDVVLSGPGYPVAVSPTGKSVTGSGTSVTATYTFTPPGGSWDWPDDGTYTLTMQPNQVYDADGVSNAVPSGALGTFAVSITSPNPIVVDNQGDTDDGNLSAGQVTLREAIRVANATVGQVDSITFAGGLSGKTITIGSEISITDPVTITGLGASNLKLSGGTLNRLFNVNLPSNSDTLTINQITLADGYTDNGTGGGGAILVNKGSVTLSSVTLDSNQCNDSVGASGGAIFFVPAAQLTFNSCTITNNSATGSSSAALAGGGVVSTLGAATVTINSCLINGNTSTLNFGGVVRGQSTVTVAINDSTVTNNSAVFGGVSATNLGAAVTVARSTISGNVATGNSSSAGGAFYFSTAGSGTFTADASTFSNNSATQGGVVSFRVGTCTFTNSTLHANTALGNGGGAIWMNTAGGNLTLNNCTVTGNAATSGPGGGIRQSISGVTITLNSTIVAENTSAGGGADIDCPAFPVSVIAGGNNLVGVANTGNFSLSGTNKTGTYILPLDPMLDVLGNNGGPTQTRALKAGSPAFSNGSNPLNLLYDQRGSGYPRLVQSGVDIGAFEGLNTIPEYLANLANVPPINATYTATVTYTDETGINTGSIDVNDVRLSGPGYGTPATPTSATVTAGNNGDKSVTVEYVFTPPGGSWDYTDDGTYQLDVQANQVYDTDGTPHSAAPGKVNSFLVAIPLPVMVVDNTDDIDDGIYTAGNFTLREAINLANAAVSTSDTITFSSSLNGQTIFLYSLTSLDITDPLTITGPGAANLTISGNNSTRVFFANIPTIGSALSISGLTIADGYKTGGSGLWITSENATVTNCVFFNNYNNAAGGAIYVNQAAATLTVNNCVFDSNSSQGGGAITTGANAGLFINNSLFTNNVQYSGNNGGAIRYNGAGGPANVAIRNSTFTGNKSAYGGGAIDFSSLSGTALVQNCTITGNISNSLDLYGGHGAISILGLANSKVILDSCIVSGNFTSVLSPVADDLNNVGGEFDANFSLIGNTTNAPNFVPDAKTTSLLGQNPLLNALASNGGPTQTMSLQLGSPAINNGSNPASLTTDQRGSGYLRTSGAKTDIGAFEVQFAPTVTGVVFGDGTSQRSTVRQIVVTFSEPVTFMGGVASAFTVHRTGNSTINGNPIGDVTLTAVPVTGPASVVTITFSGALTESAGSLIDGLYNFIIDAAQVSGVGGALDGNNDQIPGGSYSVTGTTANTFYRLYGDQNGDGTTNQIDFNAFRLAFLGGPSTIFDFNVDGQVNQTDFNAFRLRFLGTP